MFSTVELHLSHMNTLNYTIMLTHTRHSYWIHSEFNFTSTIYKISRLILQALRKTPLKTLCSLFPKLKLLLKVFGVIFTIEFQNQRLVPVGATFTKVKLNFTDAYSHLLEILGLNTEFKKSEKKNPVIMKRVRYLDGALASSLRVKAIKSIPNQYYFSLYL